MYYDNIIDLIGKTPLVKISSFDKDVKSEIYLKLEKNNLSSSIKDRYAKKYIQNYLEKGNPKPLVIPTSGNLGISFASIAAIYQVECIIVMPEDATIERKKVIKLLGATLIETPANEGMIGSIRIAKKIAQEKRYQYVDQFSDLLNAKIHYETTAKEIERDLKTDPDYIIAGMGSSGTVSGIAKHYKNKKTKVIAVLPKENEKIPGIGPGFLPMICDLSNISEIVEISAETVNKHIPYIIRKTGLLIGKSGCAALLTGLKIAKEVENKKIVIIIPDSYERYLSDE